MSKYLNQLKLAGIFILGIMRVLVYCIFSLFLYSRFLIWYSEVNPDKFNSLNFWIVKTIIVIVIIYYAFRLVVLMGQELGEGKLK